MYRFLTAVALLIGLAGAARAAPPPEPPPLDAYGALPHIDDVQLSPSGDRIAYLQVTGDAWSLVVRDRRNAVLLDASLGDNKIRGIQWAGDSHLVIEKSLTSRLFLQNDEFVETLVLNVDTQKVMGIFKNQQERLFAATFGYAGAAEKDGHWYGYFGGYPLTKTRGFNPTIDSASVTQLYRVDLDTGATELVGPAYEQPREWALGPDGAVVAHSEYDETSGLWTLHSEDGNGRLLASLKQPRREVSLEGLGPTPGTVVVDKDIPEIWNLADGSHRPLAADQSLYNAALMFDPTTRRLLGFTLSGDSVRQTFLDPELNSRLSVLRRAFGGEVSIVSWSADFKRLIVFTQRRGDPGTYWLVDGASAQVYGDAYPGIPDASVAETRVVVYKAGDGLEIHGILTLPPGRDPNNLPLVVMPHGGPQAHDTLGFDWWAQAFAGRGYAVFQPNFRGSDGYGLEFRDAGFGQWGRKMQTDISDGVAELVHEGVIDPKRVCIVGASYGGYAALAGVTVQQGLYRCAVSWGGISDMNVFLDAAIPGDDASSAAGRYLRQFTGSRSNEDPAMTAISPARLAARADAPVLLIHGADDSVVSIVQSQEMERALRAAGKPVQLIVIKGEDHWLSRDATRKAMLAASVAFVETNDPPQ